MKKEYYKIMGWDIKGKPLKETLSKLGIVGGSIEN